MTQLADQMLTQRRGDQLLIAQQGCLQAVLCLHLGPLTSLIVIRRRMMRSMPDCLIGDEHEMGSRRQLTSLVKMRMIMVIMVMMMIDDGDHVVSHPSR